MKTRDLEAELHPSIRCARDLKAIADAWPDLLAALHPTSSGQPATAKEALLPIDPHVSDTIADVTGWLMMWIRALADETDWTPPDAGVDTSSTYRAPAINPPPFDASRFGHGALAFYISSLTRPVYRLDVPTLLRALAGRTGHFTEHHDESLARAFIRESRDTRARVEGIAYPSGARRVPVHMACLEARCPGEYEAVIPPDSRWTEIPNMRCSKDSEHVITPEELRRIQRRQQRGHLTADPLATREFLARLRQQQPAHNLLAAMRGQTTATRIVRTTRRRT